MAVGETLLKITDYPFSYSVTIIIFIWMGVNVQDAKIIGELGVAGALGTFLTIVDPLGRLFKFNLKRYFEKHKQKNSMTELVIEYQVRAIKTKSIGIEMDKIVGLVYFSFVLFLFGIILALSPTFASDIMPKDKNENPLWNPYDLQVWGGISSVIILLILSIIAGKNWKEVSIHAETVGTYEYGISSPYATRETLENMRNAIDQNDWPTAEEWGKILENEIKIKKGKKDLLIQIVNEVFDPLYLENLAIEASYEQSLKTGNFQTFPSGQWSNLKTKPLLLQVDDNSLLQEIESFYKLIEEYNKIQQVVLPIAQENVKKRTPEVYGPEVREVRYWVTSLTQGENAPSLPHLILTGTHPLKPYPSESHAKPFQVDIITNDGRMSADKTQDAFDKFEILWKRLLEDIDGNKTIQNMKEMFEQIHHKNTDLKKKYIEQIAKKW